MLRSVHPWQLMWVHAMRDHFVRMHAAGPSSSGSDPDALVSLSWSPLGTRPALLTASAQGVLCVWTQAPHEDAGAPHIPAINKWHGHVLSPTDASRTAGAGAGKAPSLPAPPPPQAPAGMEDDEGV